MMKARFLAVVLCTLAISSCDKSQEAPTTKDVSAVVAAHDAQMRRELGIGVLEVGLIAQVDPQVAKLEDALQPAVKRAYGDLVRKGYLVTKSMPAVEGTLVRYKLTEKGEQISKALE